MGFGKKLPSLSACLVLLPAQGLGSVLLSGLVLGDKPSWPSTVPVHVGTAPLLDLRAPQ